MTDKTVYEKTLVVEIKVAGPMPLGWVSAEQIERCLVSTSSNSEVFAVRDVTTVYRARGDERSEIDLGCGVDLRALEECGLHGY